MKVGRQCHILAAFPRERNSFVTHRMGSFVGPWAGKSDEKSGPTEFLVLSFIRREVW